MRKQCEHKLEPVTYLCLTKYYFPYQDCAVAVGLRQPGAGTHDYG